MMVKLFLIRLFILLVLGIAGAVCMKCIECDSSVKCPALPTKGCEVVQRQCACCKECARKIGEYCSWATARCASGLMCVNDDLEALVNVPRFLTYFKGTCQFVVIPPLVVENTEVTERRNRI
ncbi:insulin-like growth factor-binding protein 2-B isoform X2 [Ostrea edulis]|uniref:insulin-like growth factor-binding protein 2-B isoform X2 n=1 Tax=Ostrea edulis TaxID=37623 RepID=UPI0024AFC7E0|nr:insulin-like growth factor-binding protein 2-B isoform X2 [Ostrea edulis]